MNNYKELKIWRKSIELAVSIYNVTQSFPKTELFGLTAQMKGSAASISSNIAEGAGRNSNRDFAKFLVIAYGSSCELETQLIISNRVNLLSEADLKSAANPNLRNQKMTWSLKRTLLRTKCTIDQVLKTQD